MYWGNQKIEMSDACSTHCIRDKYIKMLLGGVEESSLNS
jgi:hypothetical protein